MSRVSGIFLILIAMVTIAGCVKKTVFYQSEGKMEDFNPVYADFDFINARAKVVIEEESGKVTRGTMNIRAKKDSVLWFSISPGMGMEAVRGLVTQEKIKIKDRLGNEDIDMSFQEFETLYGLSLSLDLFQNLLWANPPYPFDYRDRLVRVGKAFELTQVRNQVRYFSKVDVNYAKVTELVSNSLNDRGSLLASFASYQEVNKRPFPAEVLYKLAYQLPNGSQNTIIHLDWVSINPQSEPLNFPFRF
ncbi:DUF4292 domain-containing protein [Algoriphagus sp. CAU 1675]|uniref:DUF4292 domain-containing protein n=1 Tax=Algoriphagus sp. CAU 1675 TaxID=3032597 RepID=UPI0023DA40B3|nr:DUF4292 domain-containing protein [Algoriphagus sp. CAU 1675]MDF2157128.1 DUF4292 domain-containing protein [Algoriphagus sp. CAU 1675]